MPALAAVPKVIRLDLIFTLGGDAFARNRLFFQYTGGGPNLADLTTWLGTVSTAWAAAMASRQSTRCTLTTLIATDLTSSSSPQQVSSPGVAGTNTNAPASGSLAAIIKQKINRRYRGGHPRVYFMAPTPDNLSTPQNWSAAFISGLASNWATFIGSVLTAPPASFGTLTQVNVSYFQGFTNKTFPSGRVHPVPTPRVTPVVDQIVSYSVNPRPGSQRRRNLQSP